MDKLTLDTNILRDWAWCEERSEEHRYSDNPVVKQRKLQQFQQLRYHRDNGICELGVTTQLYTDFSETKGELPSYLNEMIGPYVSIATPGLFMFPLSIPFVFAIREDIDAVFYTTFPGSESSERNYPHKRKDSMQLYAHKVAGRDYFITCDQGIIRRADSLQNEHGIRVLTLEEYLSRIQ